MGQQQLLLLVLGIVIVGIAILVGINAYSENSVKTNWDALLQDALRMANDAQAWKSKPELFGGSPDATKSTEDDFSEVTFFSMGYTAGLITNEGLCYSNVNGVFGLHRTGNHVDVEAVNLGYGNVLRLKLEGSIESRLDLKEDQSIRGFFDVEKDLVTSAVELPRGCV
jgi:hypothetical protein